MAGENLPPLPKQAGLPPGLIHQPWTATPLQLESAGGEPRQDLSAAVVDHKAGRQRALAAYAIVRNA